MAYGTNSNVHHVFDFSQILVDDTSFNVFDVVDIKFKVDQVLVLII
jgi:hypothetical protein